jgi:hypothetical protein
MSALLVWEALVRGASPRLQPWLDRHPAAAKQVFLASLQTPVPPVFHARNVLQITPLQARHIAELATALPGHLARTQHQLSHWEQVAVDQWLEVWGPPPHMRNEVLRVCLSRWSPLQQVLFTVETAPLLYRKHLQHLSEQYPRFASDLHRQERQVDAWQQGRGMQVPRREVSIARQSPFLALYWDINPVQARTSTPYSGIMQHNRPLAVPDLWALLKIANSPWSVEELLPVVFVLLQGRPSGAMAAWFDRHQLGEDSPMDALIAAMIMDAQRLVTALFSDVIQQAVQLWWDTVEQCAQEWNRRLRGNSGIPILLDARQWANEADYALTWNHQMLQAYGIRP